MTGEQPYKIAALATEFQWRAVKGAGAAEKSGIGGEWKERGGARDESSTCGFFRES